MRWKKLKKYILAVLTTALTISLSVCPAYADLESDLREEQAWTNQQLNNTYTRINELYNAKVSLQNEIAQLDAELVDVMTSIEVLKTDIEEKEKEIENTEENIKKAEKAKEKQYEAMKKRIQYLYEKGGSDAWFKLMLDADDISDLLNKAEYTQQMYEYDRECLEKYQKIVKEVESLKDKYEQEKAELEEMQLSLEEQSANLQYQIEQKKITSSDYDNEIAYAQQLANEYVALIQQQQAEIEQLEAERIAAEEEARRQAEIEAAEAASAAEEEENDSYDEDYSENYDDYGYYDSYDSYDDYDSYEYDEDYYEDSVDYENEEYSESQTTSNTSSNSSSGSGSSVVDYATQFVGNPYVWGGTSLTSGADCSGFVQSVYSNFGISLPRTSYEQQNAGTEVSYSDAQPGDLICYGGHVAIYMGNGQIVHASNAKDGIKISDNAAYRTILSVRRLT